MCNHEGDLINNNKRNESDKKVIKSYWDFTRKYIRDMQFQD